jgi:energy-coupling factor transporter ATP-binding protein EcfA2
MATATSTQVRGSSNLDDPADPRVTTFCSPRYPELFHAFVYANDVWKQDLFDVQSIHQTARKRFQHIVDRVLEPSGLAAGRILLLLGESGCGKTHLMRAFRNQIHHRRAGYCGYLQMTAFTGQYGRYVLNNLIDSLDKPYDLSQSEITGLMRLSTALADSCSGVRREQLDQLRERRLDQGTIDQVVSDLADSVILDDRFSTIDVYLVQALLYLQSNDPPIKARVLKYLRCEDLTAHDRPLLGGIVPCTYADAPPRIIERLGQLIWAVERAPLVICVDQLEDVFDLEEAAIKFRRAMATLCDIVSRLSSAIVVIACLDNFYDQLKQLLTRPIVDRVENDPPPFGLDGLCDPDEVKNLVSQRLKFLYESAGITFELEQPTFPLPDILIRKVAGLRPRDVLGEVHRYRERCIEKGKMVEYPFDGIALVHHEPEVAIMPLEQAWNEFRLMFTTVVPVDEAELAIIVANAIQACSNEVQAGQSFEAEAEGQVVKVRCRAGKDSTVDSLVGVCNKAPQGGALGRQIDEVIKRAGKYTPVIVRSTDFPSNPKSVVAQQLTQLITSGGRYVVVQDTDWRTLMALASFRHQHGSNQSFKGWLERTRPLTTLTSMRTILDLDRRID